MITIYISESTSDDFNGCSAKELAGVDQTASLHALDDQTLAAVQEAYPGEQIELTEGETRVLRENGMEDQYEAWAVLDIVGKVYESWAWLRYVQGGKP